MTGGGEDQTGEDEAVPETRPMPKPKPKAQSANADSIKADRERWITRKSGYFIHNGLVGIGTI